jgi:heme exporter protein C
MIDRSRALQLVRRGQIITVIGLVGFVGLIVRAMAFTPVEIRQGPAQKIMYIHVPAAWGALMAIFMAGVLSAAYLWLKDDRVDRAAAASAEVGVAFGAVMLTTGPFWGKPVWGAWWVWEARLTSTLFLILLFVGYLVLRDAVSDRANRARFSAVIGTMGLVLVPFVHLTVYMFRTQHPEPVILKPEGPTLPPAMFWTAMLGVLVFTVLYFGFVSQRYALAVLEELKEDEMQNAA